MKIRMATALVAVSAAMTRAAFAQGTDTYKAKCQMCHGANGAAT